MRRALALAAQGIAFVVIGVWLTAVVLVASVLVVIIKLFKWIGGSR